MKVRSCGEPQRIRKVCYYVKRGYRGIKHSQNIPLSLSPLPPFATLSAIAYNLGNRVEFVLSDKDRKLPLEKTQT